MNLPKKTIRTLFITLIILTTVFLVLVLNSFSLSKINELFWKGPSAVLKLIFPSNAEEYTTNGFYIDKANGVTFKLPEHIEIDHVWKANWHLGIYEGFMEIDVNFKQTSPIYSEYLCDIYYKKINPASINPISEKIDKKLKLYTEENLSIEIKETAFNSKGEPIGRLKVSFDDSKKRKSHEIRFLVRSGWMFWVDYTSAEESLTQQRADALDNFFEKILESIKVAGS